ncbi:MAG: (Fe-S)-binding protein [Planctomycetes bacterium]|nr:(Fe-S)-binding protein [Planctomycetota bacterium]
MEVTQSRDTQLAGMQEALACVHCGLCTQYCPTYLVTGRETANPRGRLWTMRALGEGRLEPTPAVLAELDSCLVCRACESVCPSSVQYGDVLGAFRERTRKRGFWRRQSFKVLEHPALLRALATLLRCWQRSPLRMLRSLLPQRLRRMEDYLPPVPPTTERQPLPALTPAVGTRRGVVGVLEGCVMSVLFADVNRDTVLLLTHAGYDVCVPRGQGCCGALHEHDGDLQGARRLLQRNATAFAAQPLDAIVMNSSGCGAAFHDARRHLGAAGNELSHLSVDAQRFLVDHGAALRFRPHAGRVTSDAPCHLHYAQNETSAPLQLLRRVPGLQVVEMPDAALCCGAAGVYNLDHPVMAAAILSGKLDSLAATGANILLSSNPGCILQWRNGITERGLNVEVLHPLTFLARLLSA